MAQQLKKVFLSASIPLPDRDQAYFSTADICAIRDAVNALAKIIVPNAHLVWGGHPSITPLIRYILQQLKVDTKKHVTLYQSIFFEDIFPVDNQLIENLVLTERLDDEPSSLKYMRNKMIVENQFAAGIFIGGMEGVEEEFAIFSKSQPQALLLPIASTGGAALNIFNKKEYDYSSELKTNFSYLSLFDHLLNEKI